MKIFECCLEWTEPTKFAEFPIQRNLTLNNLGSAYKKVGDMKKAMKYLNKA